MKKIWLFPRKFSIRSYGHVFDLLLSLSLLVRLGYRNPTMEKGPIIQALFLSLVSWFPPPAIIFTKSWSREELGTFHFLPSVNKQLFSKSLQLRTQCSSSSIGDIKRNRKYSLPSWDFSQSRMNSSEGNKIHLSVKIEADSILNFVVLTNLRSEGFFFFRVKGKCLMNHVQTQASKEAQSTGFFSKTLKKWKGRNN